MSTKKKTPIQTHTAAKPKAAKAAKAAAEEARRVLTSELRNFVKEATLGEIYFTRDVLCNWRDVFQAGDDDLALASAFAMAIDNHNW
jgi:hypothetical protein